MGDIFLKAIEQLETALLARERDDCEQAVADKIRQLSRSPFDMALEVNISCDPSDRAKTVDGFLEIEASRMRIATAHTEMDEFDINPRLWFCDFFAHTSYGGQDDYDWLRSWQSGDSPHYVIRGMEALQPL
jgi:hypothetical protein